MATTTPNYGWTVPTSTDLVKDGATAIETLGDAIDASMNTALGTKKAGMVLLNTTSFSAVSSVSSASTVFSLTSNSTTAFASTIYLFAPQVAEKTFVISHTIQNNEGTFTSPISMFSTGIFNATTQFDGIQLLPNTSTITGTLKVYGLN
jgi:hypothetical protein